VRWRFLKRLLVFCDRSQTFFLYLKVLIGDIICKPIKYRSTQMAGQVRGNGAREEQQMSLNHARVNRGRKSLAERLLILGRPRTGLVAVCQQVSGSTFYWDSDGGRRRGEPAHVGRGWIRDLGQYFPALV